MRRASCKLTKVPYAPDGRRSKANNPSTWGIRAAAEACAANIVKGSGGGIGIQLGDLGIGLCLCGIDLGSCIAEDGRVAPWGAEILSAIPTYTERSPSGRGVKIFFYLPTEQVRPFLDRIGVPPNRMRKKSSLSARSGV